MSHAELIARRIAESLQRQGRAAEFEANCVTLPEWAMLILVLPGEESDFGNGVSISNEIVATHPKFPNRVMTELGVGIKKTVAAAANDIADTWMQLVFAPLKFLFDEDPHDCLVGQKLIETFGDGARRYQVIGGPARRSGLRDWRPDETEGPLMWTAIQDLIPNILRGKIRHLRCFTGKGPTGPSGEVFLDGKVWPDGTRRIVQLAERFPSADKENPIRSIRQHFLIVPEDIESEPVHDVDEQVAEWRLLAQDQIAGIDRELVQPVLTGLFFLSRFGSEGLKRTILVMNGIDEQMAEDLVSFLPSAATRILCRNDVEFSDDYILCGIHTGQAHLGKFSETPVHPTATRLFEVLKERGAASEEIQTVAEMSPEYEGVKTLHDAQAPEFLYSVMYTRREVRGEPPEVLAQRISGRDSQQSKKKPWWKFF